jgi:hypothetical protein
MERLCKDCKHFSDYERYLQKMGECLALKGRPHAVWGGDIGAMEVTFARATFCGWNDPKLWEPKPKKAPDPKTEG